MSFMGNHNTEAHEINELISQDQSAAARVSLSPSTNHSTTEMETEIVDFEDDEDQATFEPDEDTGGPVDPVVETQEERVANTYRRMQMRLLRLIRDGRTFSIFHDDEGLIRAWRRRLSGDSVRRPEFPKVPSEIGIGLMDSGNFGLNEADAKITARGKGLSNKQKISLRILDRELAVGSLIQQKLNHRLIAQGMIPSSNADTIIRYNDPVYSGQFSDDGNFFFSANKDFKVRMYDTSNPFDWTYYKTVSYPFGRWTLTDASLSPDNKYLAYTSIHSNVCLAPTDPNDMGDPYSLDLAGGQSDPSVRFPSFGIWSIRFSGDGRKLVAGATGGLIVVYDIDSRTPIHKIEGHENDVNSVCFADVSSPHTLYSGSDDSVLKVWDTRSLEDSRPAGVFVGHIEGITYIDSKGDGRYILSNSKDQSAKLWDVRMVMSPQDYDSIRHTRRVNQSNFDYRFEKYNDDYWYKDPHDNSLVTFRGHRVLKTLIRCHFSPPGSTNSRYVYSGSEDGKIYIWNLDATLAGVVDVYKATLNSRPPQTSSTSAWDDPFDDLSMVHPWSTCVRDASWHPTAPVIVASAWNGYGARIGTCTVHVWNENTEGDEAVPQKLIVDPRLETNSLHASR